MATKGQVNGLSLVKKCENPWHVVPQKEFAELEVKKLTKTKKVLPI